MCVLTKMSSTLFIKSIDIIDLNMNTWEQIMSVYHKAENKALKYSKESPTIQWYILRLFQLRWFACKKTWLRLALSQ